MFQPPPEPHRFAFLVNYSDTPEAIQIYKSS